MMAGVDDPRFMADDFVASQRLDFQPFLRELGKYIFRALKLIFHPSTILISSPPASVSLNTNV